MVLPPDWLPLTERDDMAAPGAVGVQRTATYTADALSTIPAGRRSVKAEFLPRTTFLLKGALPVPLTREAPADRR